MSLDEAVRSAMALIAKDDFEGGLALFAQINQAAPGNPVVLGLMGRTCLKMGRYAQGVDFLKGAVSLHPNVDTVFDIFWGLAHMKAYGDAVALCRDFAPLIDGDVRFLPFLGLAQIYVGLYREAVATLRRAREVMPEDFYIRHNLSTALLFLGQREEAVDCFSQLLRDWDGGDVIPTPLQRLDAIAEGYDQNELHNWFSIRLLQLYRDHFPARSMQRVLELGTGTGLLASRLSGSALSVTGIERSTAMAAQARRRGVYAPLIEGDLPGVLDMVEGPFETILSSCVLYYFADLRPFFTQAARLLGAGGVFLFSVDPLSDPREVAITGPGEYAHSRAYLRRLAVESGFKEVAMEIDRHRGPPGFWCAFRKA
ncbi:hypothetical protein CCC_02844 [Paramagnetospirillum magnetotacticum MS-1]|uniref:Methyltransferase type 11 domain-containing protein n=1 Tax=Paramagnetospirillum magnetotacticum MS-1 TaxID=272627 RepID=A0A0C2YZI9_PARME|nr:tetratricopeptide repeat protein [Paramagnetospirillum magnetotacticum]KIM00056.1 hypothetical protein CCC_02844 [Paramagnetospirillum magnetotacticum MS-1]